MTKSSRINALACAIITTLFFTNVNAQTEIQRIVGNNSPNDFANFVRSAPNPDYTGDATYSITLTTVRAGGGLDFPLVLNYNSNAVRENAESGYVGLGWNLVTGQVVRSVNEVPDEQSRSYFGINEDFHLGGHIPGDAVHAEDNGILFGGDVIDGALAADEWDNYNITTPYHSANLVPIKPYNSLVPFYFVEKPYRSWNIEYNRQSGFNDYFDSFDLTDEMGRKFNFDYTHYYRVDENGDGVRGITTGETYYRFPTSWKLTRIDGPNSDHYVDYVYDAYAHAGESLTSYTTKPKRDNTVVNPMILARKRIPGDITGVVSHDESVIDYIETKTHKYVFTHSNTGASDANGKSYKKLTRIYVYSKKSNEIIEDIQLVYTSGTHSGTTTSTAIDKLTSVIIHDPRGVNDEQRYTFDYYVNNGSVGPDKFGYISTNNLLETITVPTGGTIDYEYEERRYSFYYEFDTSSRELDQMYDTNNSTSEYLAGRRVSKITLDGKADGSPAIVKEFSYGEGIRIDSNWESIISNYGSTAGFAQRLTGHIGHRWVEEKDSQGGFSKTYYTSGISHETTHVAQCNFTTAQMPNHCPSFITEEEAMGVALDINPESNFSQLTMYQSFNASYGKPYKIETGYYTGSNPTVVSSTDSRWIMVASDQVHPQSNSSGFASDVNNMNTSFFVYKLFDKQTIDGKRTDTYYVNHFVGTDCSPSAPNCRSRFHAIYDLFTPPGTTIVTNQDSTLVTEHLYTAGIGAMHNKNVNMIGYKVGEIVSKEVNTGDTGTLYATLLSDINSHTIDYPGLNSSFYSSTLPFYKGYYTYWDNSDGEYRPRETWEFTESKVNRNTPSPCLHPLCNDVYRNLPYSNNGRLVQNFDDYDADGNLLQISDINGVKTSYEYTSDGLLTGVFSNADKDEVYAHSFAYDGFGDWVPNDNGDNDTEFFIEDGKLKIKNHGSAADSERDNIYYNHGSEITQRLIWEFDLKIDDSEASDLQINAGGSSWDYRGASSSLETAIWTTINNEDWRVYDGSAWITINANKLIVGETYAFKIVMDPTNDDADFYIDGELLQSGISFRFNSSGIQKFAFGNYGYGNVTTEWYIDNIRIYPEKAQATTQELDYYSGKPLSVKEINGGTQRFIYDGFSRLTEYYNTRGRLTNTYSYNNTAFSSGSYVYSSSNPNSIESTLYSNVTTSYDFSNSSGWSSVNPTHNVFNVQKAGETTVQMGSGGAYEGINISSIGENLITRIDFYPDTSTGGTPHIILDSSGNRFGVHYLHASDSFRIQFRKNYGSWTYPFTFPLDAPIDTWYTIELQKIGSELTAWVYPKGQDRDPNNRYTLGDFDASWTPNFTLSGNDNYYYAANLDISTGFQHTTSYVDGLGRPIQSQMIGQNEKIVSGTIYDSRGLEVASSRPISVTGGAGYVSNLFGASFVPGSALPSTSPLEDYYDAFVAASDEDYAYSYTEYEQSMTRRPIKSTLPGYSHRSGSGNESTSSYALNSVAISTPNKTWAVNSLHKTISEDPSGKQTISYSNFRGETVASGVDMNLDGTLTTASTDLITTFEYDYLGNLILVEDPRGLETTYSYSTNGELLEKKLPDQDYAHKYCYDKKGRLRFHLDPNKSSTPTYYYGTPHYDYTYYKYDEFDRIVETGEQIGFSSTNAAETSFDLICASSTLLENQNEPNSSVNIKAEYSYDGTDAYSGARNLKGRLTKVRYNEYYEYSVSSTWGESYYSYNELGQVEWVVQKLPGLTGDKKITYSYDDTGRLTEIGYNVTDTSDDHYFWYEYDELGRLKYVYSDTDPDPSGRTKEMENVSFIADGAITQMKLGSSTAQTVDYAYTVQGWLSTINTLYLAYDTDKFGLELSYALNGNISIQKWSQASKSTTHHVEYDYTYDNANRLTAADYTNSNTSATDDNSNGYDVMYSYDDNGNMLTAIRKGQGFYSYPQNSLTSTTIADTSNRITTYGVQNGPTSPINYSVVYDANGNMKNNRYTNAVFDWRNLMTKVTKNSSTLRFGYDVEGNRTRKEVIGGTETHYVRGAMGETIAVYENGSRAFMNLIGPGGNIIGSYDGSERRYFLKDHLGSIRTTVDQSGNVDGYDDYYPFGDIMPGRSSNTSNPDDAYKFTGHERDEEASLDLDYMLARNYDPVLSRFVQIDPLSDKFPGWTPYHYVHNNPLKLVDPTGMSAENADSCPTCRQVLSRAFSWLEPIWNRKGKELESKSNEIRQEVKQEVSEVTEAVVKQGPEALDQVSEGATQATVFIGTGAVVAAATPVPVDDIGIATGTGIAAFTAATSDALATTLSVIDANFYGGDQKEAEFRVNLTLLSISSAYAFSVAYGQGLKQTLLNEYKQNALRTTAATTTTIIGTSPTRENE